jgi:hypothetical protein
VFFIFYFLVFVRGDLMGLFEYGLVDVCCVVNNVCGAGFFQFCLH